MKKLSYFALSLFFVLAPMRTVKAGPVEERSPEKIRKEQKALERREGETDAEYKRRMEEGSVTGEQEAASKKANTDAKVMQSERTQTRQRSFPSTRTGLLDKGVSDAEKADRASRAQGLQERLNAVGEQSKEARSQETSEQKAARKRAAQMAREAKDRRNAEGIERLKLNDSQYEGVKQDRETDRAFAAEKNSNLDTIMKRNDPGLKELIADIVKKDGLTGQEAADMELAIKSYLESQSKITPFDAAKAIAELKNLHEFVKTKVVPNMPEGLLPQQKGANFDTRYATQHLFRNLLLASSHSKQGYFTDVYMADAGHFIDEMSKKDKNSEDWHKDQRVLIGSALVDAAKGEPLLKLIKEGKDLRTAQLESRDAMGQYLVGYKKLTAAEMEAFWRECKRGQNAGYGAASEVATH